MNFVENLLEITLSGEKPTNTEFLCPITLVKYIWITEGIVEAIPVDSIYYNKDVVSLDESKIVDVSNTSDVIDLTNDTTITTTTTTHSTNHHRNTYEYQLILSSGIHGNETAPIEMMARLLLSIGQGKFRISCPVLFIFGNPDAMRIDKRFKTYDLNRLFTTNTPVIKPSTQVLPSDANVNTNTDSNTNCPQTNNNISEVIQYPPESERVLVLQEKTSTFFAKYDTAIAIPYKVHLDLHTAIRGSKYEKFALTPSRIKIGSKKLFSFLLQSEVFALVVQSIKSASTFTSYTSGVCNAYSVTLELGKSKPFGQNLNNDLSALETSLTQFLQTGQIIDEEVIKQAKGNGDEDGDGDGDGNNEEESENVLNRDRDINGQDNNTNIEPMDVIDLTEIVDTTTEMMDTTDSTDLTEMTDSIDTMEDSLDLDLDSEHDNNTNNIDDNINSIKNPISKHHNLKHHKQGLDIINTIRKSTDTNKLESRTRTRSQSKKNFGECYYSIYDELKDINNIDKLRLYETKEAIIRGTGKFSLHLDTNVDNFTELPVGSVVATGVKKTKAIQRKKTKKQRECEKQMEIEVERENEKEKEKRVIVSNSQESIPIINEKYVENKEKQITNNIHHNKNNNIYTDNITTFTSNFMSTSSTSTPTSTSTSALNFNSDKNEKDTPTRLKVRYAGACILFPNSNVGKLLRAGLLIVPITIQDIIVQPAPSQPIL